METKIKEIIEKFKDAQKHIIAKREYADRYYEALTDCISVAESFLEKYKTENKL